MHHKGKFWNTIHLGEKNPANPQLTPSHFLEQELRHRIMDLLPRLKEKSIRSHRHRARGAHWSSLSPVQQKPEGLHLLQPACRNATLAFHLSVLSTIMRIYTGTSSPSPVCSQHAANSKLRFRQHRALERNWWQCHEISWKVCSAAARLAGSFFSLHKKPEECFY